MRQRSTRREPHGEETKKMTPATQQEMPLALADMFDLFGKSALVTAGAMRIGAAAHAGPVQRA